MSLDVHIGRLILDGVEVRRHDRDVLRKAFAAELACLLAAGGLGAGLAGGAVAASLSGGTPVAAADARELGIVVARRVYEGLSK